MNRKQNLIAAFFTFALCLSFLPAPAAADAAFQDLGAMCDCQTPAPSWHEIDLTSGAWVADMPDHWDEDHGTAYALFELDGGATDPEGPFQITTEGDVCQGMQEGSEWTNARGILFSHYGQFEVREEFLPNCSPSSTDLVLSIRYKDDLLEPAAVQFFNGSSWVTVGEVGGRYDHMWVTQQIEVPAGSWSKSGGAVSFRINNCSWCDTMRGELYVDAVKLSDTWDVSEFKPDMPGYWPQFPDTPFDGIADDHAFRPGEEPFFPYGFFQGQWITVRPADKDAKGTDPDFDYFAAMESAHMNAVTWHGIWWGRQMWTEDNWWPSDLPSWAPPDAKRVRPGLPASVARAAKHGIRTIPQFDIMTGWFLANSYYGDMNEWREQHRQVTSGWANSPDILYWFVTDERFNEGWLKPLPWMREGALIARENSPNIPVGLSEMGFHYDRGNRQLNAEFDPDVVMIDSYLYGTSKTVLDRLLEQSNKIDSWRRMNGTGGHRSLQVFIGEGAYTDDNWEHNRSGTGRTCDHLYQPCDWEIVAQGYNALVHGASGLLFFRGEIPGLFGESQYNDMWAGFRQLGEELFVDGIADVILDPSTETAFDSLGAASGVHYMWKKTSSGDVYLLALNLSGVNQNATFYSPWGIDDGVKLLYDGSEDDQVAVSGSTFTDTFSPIERKVYLFPGNGEGGGGGGGGGVTPETLTFYHHGMGSQYMNLGLPAIAANHGYALNTETLDESQSCACELLDHFEQNPDELAGTILTESCFFCSNVWSDSEAASIAGCYEDLQDLAAAEGAEVLIIGPTPYAREEMEENGWRSVAQRGADLFDRLEVDLDILNGNRVLRDESLPYLDEAYQTEPYQSFPNEAGALKMLEAIDAWLPTVTGGGEPECGTDADCDDGLYCNGVESCVDGACESGEAVTCDDGLYCNGVESCDESADSCAAGTPVVCDDGLYCSGVETCDEGTDACVSAGDPCTGGTVCNEDDDSCDTPPECTVDADCADDLFCNGAEACVDGACVAGTPVACDDGLYCNGVESCDEEAGACAAGEAVACDDGLFCTGAETCDEDADACVSDGNPCTVGEICNEDGDACDAAPECETDADCADGTFCNGVEECVDSECVIGEAIVCDDGLYCTGAETCDEDADACVSSGDPCSGGEVCNEDGDSCETAPDCTVNADCSDGLYCNGVEMCVSGACVAGTPVQCDDAMFCTGVESCDEASDQCVSSGDPCGSDEVCYEEEGGVCIPEEVVIGCGTVRGSRGGDLLALVFLAMGLVSIRATVRRHVK